MKWTLRNIEKNKFVTFYSECKRKSFEGPRLTDSLSVHLNTLLLSKYDQPQANKSWLQ